MKKFCGGWRFLGILVVATWLLGSATQAGAETFTMKARQSHHNTKVHAIEVGDVPGHILIVWEQGGLAFIEGGQVTTASSKGMSDYTEGRGQFQGYNLYTFEDGSTIWSNVRGTATPAPDGKTTWYEGTFEYIKGTGRFEGIQGGGSFTGKRVGPPVAGAEVYTDHTGTYTLPSR